jgi:hypothetical protein
LRKYIGLAAGREDLDVRSVAKLKTTFISPFCHNLQQKRKCRCGEAVQIGTLTSTPNIHLVTRHIDNEKFKQPVMF